MGNFAPQIEAAYKHAIAYPGESSPGSSGPNCIKVATVHELGALLQQELDYWFSPSCRESDPYERSKQEANRILKHEAAHARAAEAVGAKVLGFGIVVEVTEDDRPARNGFTYIDFASVLDDPLRHAAIFLHPADPSEADMLAASELGYSNQADLAIDAMDYNRTNGYTIPLPLFNHD